MVKSGKEKDRKSGSQRKKKSDGPDIPWKEALLAYDIRLKQKALVDSRFQLKQLQDENARFKARNRQLKEDQEAAVSNLLKTSREFEKMLNDKDVVSKDQVIAHMMQNWEMNKANNQQLAELEEQLVSVGEEVTRKDSQLSYWKQFRDRGQHENDKTIHLLEQELVDMEASFTEISNHLRLTLNRAKAEIEKAKAEILDKQKYIATEKAVARMDKYGRREVVDNDWLIRETEIHRKEVADLFRTIEKLEDKNLEILSELFECQVEDLNISRNFFMTQFVDNENLSKKTLLEIDVAEMTQSHLTGADQSCDSDTSQSVLHSQQQQQRPKRQKSAVYQDVEDKIFLLDQLHASRDQEETGEQSDMKQREVAARAEEHDEEQDEEDSEQEEGEEQKRVEYDCSSHYDGSLDTRDSDPFLEFHHFDDEDFEDFLKLGPLELKLLNVSGKRMSIQKPRMEEDIMQMKEVRPDDWPVTVAMLHRTLGHERTPRSSGEAEQLS